MQFLDIIFSGFDYWARDRTRISTCKFRKMDLTTIIKPRIIYFNRSVS